MRRRDFIRSTGLTAAGALAAPYILPSGRLFAQTGSRSAAHVVLVMFAGGVRHQEAVGMRYLDDSQMGEPYPGNIMYNMLTGEAPVQKIVYGTGPGGINPIPSILNQSLQSQGTLFSEVRAFSAGHYGGLNSILQGSTVEAQGLKQRPVSPTIFEYLRRHGGYSATDMWFVGNGIGGSVPLLNYSEHPDYGIQYGANFFAPTVTFHPVCQQYLGNAKVYHPENELNPMYQLKAFLDNNFLQDGQILQALGNTPEEKQQIKLFMELMYDKTNNGTIALPPVADSGDLYTVGYACEVMSYFKPALTVVNLSNVDACHSSFTTYVKALHRADHAVGHLWNHIQTNIPEMAQNTVIIAIPECGRNDAPNAIIDENNWLSYDHSDQNSLRIFTLMAGPGIPQGLVLGSENNAIGQVSDAMLTVADLLGVKPETTNAGFLAPGTLSFLDQL
ncbi:MAG: hypothetical protein ACK5XQ_06115 [Flavobacteriales bacterium]|jgi:hypothetical protein